MAIHEFNNPGEGDHPLRREIFEIARDEIIVADSTGEKLDPGWYWMPADMAQFDPTGPFVTEAQAIADARP